MKNTYFVIVVLFVGFTRCKNTEKTHDQNLNDSISARQNRLEVNDTLAFAD